MISFTNCKSGLIIVASDIYSILRLLCLELSSYSALRLPTPNLHGPERIRSDLLDPGSKLIEHVRKLVVFVYRDLHQLDALGLELEPVQSLAHLAEAGVRELAALDEVALVVLSELAAEKQHTVGAL